jgi:thiamine-monophosphate kinase
VLRAESVPVSDDARRMDDGRSPLEHALGDGEDFELVFAVGPEDARALLRAQPVPGVTLAAVGECVERGLWLEEAGARRPLAPAGWVHALD